MSQFHIIHWEPLWKRKKVSRSEWRRTHIVGKKSITVKKKSRG